MKLEKKMLKFVSRIFQTKSNWFSVSTCKNQVFNEKPPPSVLQPQRQWEKPVGFDTGIKVHNEILREKVPFILRNKGIATWYSCGPTVYADAHIGHASCYVKFDIVRKILNKVFKIQTVTLMGITDIDDKIIRRAAQENCTIEEISRKYEMDFFSDLELLNVERPTMVARVTEHIPSIISFCETLISKDFAYVTTEGNVYFIVSKAKCDDNDDEQAGAEVSSIIDPLKRDPRDFALWKTAKLGERSWSSPWGKGRPGWHIECSAMASDIFGNKIDIHTGGSDLRFPHHANENSQCEAYHGKKQWVNYWMHSGLLHMGSHEKMSKSLGNVITIKDFFDSQQSASIFRIMCLQSHYRQDIQCLDEELDVAKGTYLKLHNFLNDAEFYIAGELQCEYLDSDFLYSRFISTQQNVLEAFADDFNTSRALNCITDLVGEMNKYFKPTDQKILSKDVTIIAIVSSYVDNILSTLGIDILSKKRTPVPFNRFIDTVVKFRNDVRLYALSNKSKNHAGANATMSACDNYTTNDYIQLLQSLETLKKNVESFGIHYHPGTGWSVANSNKTHQIQSFSGNFTSILEDLSTFCKTVFQSGVTDRSEENIHKEASFRKHLLKASDDFRTALYQSAICVKDTKQTSVWYPLDKAICIDILNK